MSEGGVTFDPERTTGSRPTEGPELVVRAAPYRLAEVEPRCAASGVMATPEAELLRAVLRVAEIEGPLHFSDLALRVASACGDCRLGSRR
jgi:hypothetical protein